MIYEQSKFIVPSTMSQGNLNNFHTKKSAPQQFPSQNQAYPGDYLKNSQLGKASQVFENGDYSDYYAPPQKYWENPAKLGNFSMEEGTSLHGASTALYYEDQLDESVATTSPDGVFHEPSNEISKLSQSRMPGFPVSQKSGNSQNLSTGPSKDLLQRLSTLPHIPNPSVRSVGVKSRGSALYKNLNMLMNGQNPKASPINPGNVNKQQPILSKPEVEPKAYQQSNTMEITQSFENPRNVEMKAPKSNAILDSLVKIEKKINNKLKAERIAVGERKRSKRFWDAERDAQLHTFIKMYGLNWVAIAQAFNDPEITPELAQERYETRISPQISKARFTYQEDQQIVHYYNTFGPNWKRIAAYLPGRTETMVRNRFYTSIKKRLPSGQFENRLGDNLADVSVSAASSGYKVATQSSYESNVKYDDLSEKYTGKFSEAEVNSGSTAASFSLKKKLTNLRGNLKTKLEVAVFQEQAKTPAVQNATYFSEQWENDLKVNNEAIKNNDLFEAGPLQVDKQSTCEGNVLGKQADAFICSEIKPQEQDFWAPFDFGNENNKESNDLVGFDKLSIFNDNEIFQDQNLNPGIQDNTYEGFLNFDLDNRLPQMEEEAQSSIFGANLQPQDGVVKVEEQVQQTQPTKSQASAKLSHLETLLMQIQSIEKLFDRTKQEINSLQSRLATR